MLPRWEEVSGDKRAFAESFAAQYRASDPVTGARLVEAYPHGVYVVQNPPAAPLTQNEMDAVYRLPMRARGILPLPTTRPAACRRFRGEVLSLPAAAASAAARSAR